jgi:hypothetical protein
MPHSAVVLEDVTLPHGCGASFNTTGHRGFLSTPRSSVASSNNMEQRDILQQYEAALYPDATLLRGVEGCHTPPWFWRMSRCPMVVEDATLPHGVEGCRHHSTSLRSVASFNITEHCGIFQHHVAAWHPSTPWSSVASFNNMEQRDILQQYEAALMMPCCSVVSMNVTLLRGVGGCQAASW